MATESDLDTTDEQFIWAGVFVVALACGLQIKWFPHHAWMGATVASTAIGWWITRLVFFPGVAERYVAQHPRRGLWHAVFGGEERSVRFARAFAVAILAVMLLTSAAVAGYAIYLWTTGERHPGAFAVTSVFTATSWLTWRRRAR